MPLVHFPWILADVESFMGTIIMMVAIAGWVINIVNQAKPGAPPRKPAPPRPQQSPSTIQGEIEKFLAQTRQNTPDSAKPAETIRPLPPDRPGNPPARRAPVSEEGRRKPRAPSSWEERSGQRASRTRSLTTQQAPTSAKQTSSPVSLPKSPRTGHSAAKSPLSKGEESPFSQRKPGVNDRITTSVAQDLTPHLIRDARAHLGSFTGESATSLGEIGIVGTTRATQTPATNLARMLRSKRSVREAILLSEIMAKPRVLRQ